ncbi:MAG: hypothetical protein V4463_02775 [Pseudomonadota bacterium]
MALYLSALAVTAGILAIPYGAVLQWTALVFIGAHLLELMMFLPLVRRYRGGMGASVALTLLFGAIHLIPLRRQA